MKQLLATLLSASMALGLAGAGTSAPLQVESLPIRQCKAYIQGRIDVIDAEMHKCTKDDVARKLLKRRDKLKAQLAKCAGNPRAYEKDI